MMCRNMQQRSLSCGSLVSLSEVANGASKWGVSSSSSVDSFSCLFNIKDRAASERDAAWISKDMLGRSSSCATDSPAELPSAWQTWCAPPSREAGTQCARLSDEMPVSPSSRLSPSRSFTSEYSDSLDQEVPEEHSSYLSEGRAAMELFLKLNHARQTVDYVKRQMSAYAVLDKGSINVWDALELLNGVREFETALMSEGEETPTMGLLEHALQTAEACRLAHPEADWLHLVGLLHSLGKLLAHQRFGALPQWTICGESFPVGCRFSPKVGFSSFFSVNPDRRRRVYNTSTGMYSRNCGLKQVYMSWSACEYLHLVLALNQCQLPPVALFIIRYRKFDALLKGAYQELLSEEDKAFLPWLHQFRHLSTFQRRSLPGALTGQALKDYYTALIDKYIPGAVLRW